MKKNLIPVILITFLLVSAVVSLLLNLLQDVIKLDSSIVQLTQFSTAFGALIVWVIWRKHIPFPRVTKQGIVKPLLLAMGLSAVVLFILLSLQAVGLGSWPTLDVSSLLVPFVILAGIQLLGAAGEEVGWRGLVQPLLETRTSLLKAAIITGLLFGIGHFYVISAGILIYILFIISAISLSIALATVTAGRSFKMRVLIATVFHWLINMVFTIGFSGGDETLLWIAYTAIATGVIGAICLPYLVVNKRVK